MDKKAKIVIADLDFDYIMPLQARLAKMYYNQVELEIITDKDYYKEFLSSPKSIDILLVSEELYDNSLNRHKIDNIFVLVENDDNDKSLNQNLLYKYTSVKEILNIIFSKSKASLSYNTKSITRKTKVILVFSASGGVGKTTLSLGLSACLAKNYRSVLYMEACRLNTFHYFVSDKEPIATNDVYAKLGMDDIPKYNLLKNYLKIELFSYVPPFKASLMSLNLNYDIFEKIAVSFKKSNEFDCIVIDTDSVFDDYKARLLEIADKVLIVTKQTKSSAFALKQLIVNMSGLNSDKYIIVCNDFCKDSENAVILPEYASSFSVNEYVNHIENCETKTLENLSEEDTIKRLSFLMI